jgi:hypothetical protein
MYLLWGWREIPAGISLFGRFRQEGVTKAPNPNISGIKAWLSSFTFCPIARDVRPKGAWGIRGAGTCAERFLGFS